MSSPCRVLIVDDSRIFRGVIEQALTGLEEVEVIGSVWSGEKALEFVEASPPDLVTLDVEMPGLDGLATLRRIQHLNAARPEVPPVGVLMVSALTRPGCALAVEALQSGAFDAIAKPAGPSAEDNLQSLRQQLSCKVRLWAGQRAVSPQPVVPIVQSKPAGRPARALLVAASTGGPEALARILPPICERTDLPVFVVQHMPPLFTEALAASLDRKCRHRVIEAVDNDPVVARTVYLAPGGRHLFLRREQDAVLRTGVNDQPPENNCRPAADVLFRSAAQALGGEVVALVLTGMMNDGTAGLRPLKRAGARVIAQDQASSVVWGMPGSAVAAGLVDQVLPLDCIPGAVHALLNGK